MKNVLITGANGGIGRALVEKYASMGYKIIAHMRAEKPEFKEFSDELQDKYNTIIDTVYFDLENENAIKQGLYLLSRSRIDVLINCAGIEHGGLFQMTPLKDVRRVFDINFFSCVQITQIVSRVMLRFGGGSIINIASIAGIDVEAGNIAYGTSKAALIAFTKTIAKELAPLNIRVNAVAPGLTDTRMAVMMEKKAGSGMLNKTALKRLAKPEEIADAVYYLSSEESSFITGQVIRVDGGM